MTLFCSAGDPVSHRVRFMLAEKNLAADIRDLDPAAPLPEDLIELNPYQSLPTLVDRDLAIYTARIIEEYIDERFPHPPLMPIDPIGRARLRTLMYRIERDWYPLVDALEHPQAGREAEAARRNLRESLIVVAPLFEKFALANEEFSLVDCAVVPILWRLQRYRIELPASARVLQRYAERMYARPGFQRSLAQGEATPSATRVSRKKA